MDRNGWFIGSDQFKVDNKGRVSVPVNFRRVLAAGDPQASEGQHPRLYIVYGNETRHYLECFTVEAMDRIQAKIAALPLASKKRKAASRLYSTNAQLTAMDENGRLVLSARLRNKIGITDEALFAGTGDAFEIWNPQTYDAESMLGLDEDEDFDPDLDASHYLDG